MFKMFLIELKKIFMQKKTYIIWVVLLLLLLSNLKVNILDKEHQASYIMNNKIKMENIKNSINHFENKLSDKNISADSKKDLETLINTNQEKLKNYYIILDENADEMGKLKAKINIIKIELTEMSEGLSSGPSSTEYNKEVRFLEYLYENKIPEYNANKNAFKYIFNFFGGGFAPVVIIFIFILLSSDIVSKEIEESTIKLLLIQPVSRFKIITSKYLAMIASIIIIILSSISIAFVLVGINYGFGNPSYPVVNGMKYSFDKIANIYTYIEGSEIYISSIALLAKLILSSLLLYIAVASICFMISVFSNTSIISISIGIIFNIVMLYGVFGSKLFEDFSQYIYISYYNMYNVFSGKAVEILKNGNISPELGITQMILIIVITYIVSCIKFANKEI